VFHCLATPLERIANVGKGWSANRRWKGYTELQAYFAHVDKVLHLKQDYMFNSKIVSATFDSDTNSWFAKSDNGTTFRTNFLISTIGFAAKRYIPEWDGLDTFQGTMQHSLIRIS